MKKETLLQCKVHSLPTNDKSKLSWLPDVLMYSYRGFDENGDNCHLYITQKKEAKTNDHFLLELEGKIQVLQWLGTNSGRKVDVVIATTNPKLGLVARPSNAFLSKYAELQGCITDVMVKFNMTLEEISSTCLSSKLCQEAIDCGQSQDFDICKDGCVQAGWISTVVTALDGTITTKPYKSHIEKHEISNLFKNYTSSEGTLHIDTFVPKLARLINHTLPSNWKGSVNL